MQKATAQNVNIMSDSLFIKSMNCFEKNNDENSYLLAYCQDTATHKRDNDNNRKEMRDILEAKKREYFIKEMNLTDEEAKVFFPVLNQLDNKFRKIGHERKQLLSDFENKKNIITDAEAKQINKQLFDIQKREFDLKTEYHSIFETILSPKKLFLFYNAQEKFMRGLLRSMGGTQNKNNEPPPPFGFDRKL
jgi:hypothetical protein